ncbi:hypothetical protein EMIHUDRAFT_460407, partial [Emiliania huxleyi CCMP1516]
MAALAAALMSADASVLALSGPLSPATAGKGADAQVDLTPMPYSPPKLSFSNPYKAYAGGNIPGWEYGGETSLNNDYIMLTTATSNKLGWIWTTEPIEIDDWEVQLEFHIGGDPRQSTGGGMAVWFTEQQGRAGAMYGQSDDFRGVGILFDSYGGGESGERVEPFVAVEHQVGICYAAYRNLKNIVRARIAWTNGQLRVWLDLTSSNHFQPCIETVNLRELAKQDKRY